MFVHNNICVLSGGSSVSKGYWNAIDFPINNNQGFWIPELRKISKLFADYLLAIGMVNKGFGYLKYKDLVVIQSRVSSCEPPQEHHFFSSLLLYFASNPEDTLMLKTPFSREKSISIRHRIIKGLENVGITPKEKFLQFIPKETE